MIIIETLVKPDSCEKCLFKNLSGGCTIGAIKHTTFAQQYANCPIIGITENMIVVPKSQYDSLVKKAGEAK